MFKLQEGIFVTCENEHTQDVNGRTWANPVAGFHMYMVEHRADPVIFIFELNLTVITLEIFVLIFHKTLSRTFIYLKNYI